MNSTASAANKVALWLAAGAVLAFAATSPTMAQSNNDRRSGARASGPNVVYQQGPRTRVYISKRSWLDGGTEVNPGDRKFTDYAIPPAIGYPTFARENNNRPIDRQPLSTPADLGGAPTGFPLY